MDNVTIYPNGQIPTRALTGLSVGGYLLSGVAASFEVWRSQAAAAGYTLTITSAGDAYRSLDRQIAVFLQRYIPQATGGGIYGDVRWYRNVRYVRRHGAAAAVPGTSNHGKGLAVDIANAGPFGGPFHDWLLATGPALGFTNTEGRSVHEPWHWVHDGVTRPTLPNTATTQEEDDMFTSEDRALLSNLYSAMFKGGSSMPGGVSLPQRIEDRLNELPNQVWLAPATGVDPKTGVAQTHPAVDWLTVMSFRIAAGASADAIVNAIPTEIAREVADLLAKRLKD